MSTHPALHAAGPAGTSPPGDHADRVLDLLAQRPWARPVATEFAVPRPPVALLPVRRAAAPKPRWPGLGYVALALGGSAALLGCASPAPPTPAEWRVQPLLRSGASDSTAMRDGYIALARRHEYDGRWAAAAEAWAQAARQQPTDPGLQTALGVALAQAGRADDAVEPLRRAVALAPGRAQALNNLGYALWLAGRTDEAVQALRAALEIDPAHAAARANLAAVQAPPVAAAGAAVPQAVATVTAPLLEILPPSPGVAVAVQTQPNLAPLGAADDAKRPVAEAAAVEAAAIEAEAGRPARIAIANGMGIAGAAAKLGGLLAAQGLPAATLHNLPPYRQAATVVQYRAGFAAAALQVARHVPGGAAVAESPLQGRPEDVRIVLGHDRRTALALCVAINQCAGAEVERQVAQGR